LLIIIISRDVCCPCPQAGTSGCSEIFSRVSDWRRPHPSKGLFLPPWEPPLRPFSPTFGFSAAFFVALLIGLLINLSPVFSIDSIWQPIGSTCGSSSGLAFMAIFSILPVTRALTGRSSTTLANPPSLSGYSPPPLASSLSLPASPPSYYLPVHPPPPGSLPGLCPE